MISNLWARLKFNYMLLVTNGERDSRVNKLDSKVGVVFVGYK